MQFSTMEKIRNVSLSGSEILECLVVILGIDFICFFEIFTVSEEKFMPSNAQKYRKY